MSKRSFSRSILPGGEVLASDEINQAIRKFQETTHKPVVASMGDLAASGGYYISAPCRWIVANELTLTGSIGVIMDTYNYRAIDGQDRHPSARLQERAFQGHVERRTRT